MLLWSNTITLVLHRIHDVRSSCNVYSGGSVTERKATGFIIETFAVLSILGILAAVALPNVGEMIERSMTASSDSEFHNVRTAVIEMLYDSSTGALVPVGPTADTSEVRTSDTPPLVLTDYLIGQDTGSIILDNMYSFAVDGTVTQIEP